MLHQIFKIRLKDIRNKDFIKRNSIHESLINGEFPYSGHIPKCLAFSKSANCEKPYTVRALEHFHDKTHYFAALQANIALKPFISLAFSTINQISRNI